MHPDYVEKKDQVHSDIDLISVDLADASRVTVVNCKSWMDGFDCKFFSNNLSDPERHDKEWGGKATWKHFRELVVPKWTEAFVERIRQESPSVSVIDYVIFCVFAKNSSHIDEWIGHAPIQEAFSGMPVRLGSISVRTISEAVAEVQIKTSDFSENSHFARTLQLLKAGGLLGS